MDGLDLTVWPCHPVGSWQRALAHQANGLEVEQADARALAVWDKSTEKMGLILRHNAKVAKVVDAAIASIEPGEVIGSWELSRRIAHKRGTPTRKRTVEILKSIRPTSRDAGALGKRGGLCKRYIDNLSGKPGHFFAHDQKHIDEFIEQRLAARREIGTRMSANLKLGRLPKRDHNHDNPRQP